MASNPPGQGFQNKNRVAILAELDKEKRKLLMQNQSSTNHPGASISLARSSLNKDYRDHAEQQHIAAQQKAALQVKRQQTCCPDVIASASKKSAFKRKGTKKLAKQLTGQLTPEEWTDGLPDDDLQAVTTAEQSCNF